MVMRELRVIGVIAKRKEKGERKKKEAAEAMDKATTKAINASAILARAQKDLADTKGTPEEVDKAQAYVAVAQKGQGEATAQVEALRIQQLPLYADDVEAAKEAAKKRVATTGSKAERDSAQDATYGPASTVTDARHNPLNC